LDTEEGKETNRIEKWAWHKRRTQLHAGEQSFAMKENSRSRNVLTKEKNN
jgi:hypothetical protein